MRDGMAYDGTPVQSGTESRHTNLTGESPHFSIAGLREAVVVARRFVDDPQNRSRSYVEYDCRDLYTMEPYIGCRRAYAMGGLNNGDCHVLRPATNLIEQTTGDVGPNTPARRTDGDRVLIGFVEGSKSRAIIIGVLTHSFSHYGATAEDGDRRMILHNECRAEIDKLGQLTVTHKTGATVTFLDSGDVVLAPASGRDLFIGANGATENLVLGQQLKQFLSNLIDALLSATYPTGTGPSGSMLPPSSTTLQSLQAQLDALLSKMSFTTEEV